MKARKVDATTLAVEVKFQRDGACLHTVSMQCTPSSRINTSKHSMPLLLQLAARAAEAVHASECLQNTGDIHQQLHRLAVDAHQKRWSVHATETVSATHTCQVSGHTWRPSSAVVSSGSLVLLHRDRPMDLQVPALHARLQATVAGPETEVFVIAMPTRSGQVWMRTFVGSTDQSMKPALTNSRAGTHVPSTITFQDLHALTRDVHTTAVRSLLGVHANLGRPIKSTLAFCEPFLVHRTSLPCKDAKRRAEVVTVLRAC